MPWRWRAGWTSWDERDGRGSSGWETRNPGKPKECRGKSTERRGKQEEPQGKQKEPQGKSDPFTFLAFSRAYAGGGAIGAHFRAAAHCSRARRVRLTLFADRVYRTTRDLPRLRSGEFPTYSCPFLSLFRSELLQWLMGKGHRGSRKRLGASGVHEIPSRGPATGFLNRVK
jgi:hypothetical protein